MQCAALVVGNSSSGVVETPRFGVPTVNIGSRQAGRIICQNVLCCAAAAPNLRPPAPCPDPGIFRRGPRRTKPL